MTSNRISFQPVPMARMCRAGQRCALSLAVCLVVAVGIAIAQDDNDFADPLAPLRDELSVSETPSSVMERTAPEAAEARRRWAPLVSPAPRVRDEAGAARNDAPVFEVREGVDEADRQVSSFFGRIKAGIGDIATQIGLDSRTLLSLLVAGLAGFALLLGWSLFRRGSRRSDMADDDIYLKSGRGRHRARRRTLGDEKTEATARSVPQARATPQKQTVVAHERNGRKAVAETDPNDPSTWRKPNMDRLKSSIRDDWFASKSAMPDDDDAALFESDESPDFVGSRKAPARSDDHPRHRDDRPVSAVTGGWEEWDEALEDSQTVWGEFSGGETGTDDLPAERAEALRRVRALRDSLRAS